MSMTTRLSRQVLRDEMRTMLANYDFNYFVTLATHASAQQAGPDRIRMLLRKWDAWTNRRINGPRWQRRPEQRLLWFAFPESLRGSPHWHLVVQMDPDLDTPERQARAARFPLEAEIVWKKLCRSGTFDCRPVADEGVFRYITKELSGLENFERFIFWREFMND